VSPPFVRRDAQLFCEDVPLARIADAVGTPAYVYSAAGIEAAYRAVDHAVSFAPHLVAYAVKANGNLAILSLLAKLGCGADIVSGGELARCIEAGMPKDRIVFSGVGKRDDEIEAALRAGIRSLHVESAPELHVLAQIARRLGVRAKVALRVNPDVDPETHPYIATGLHDTKFGVELDVARELVRSIVASEHLELDGLACHIGSQVRRPSALREAVAIVARFAIECRDAGAPVRTLDAGGGFPITYGHEKEPYPGPGAYGDAIRLGLEDAGAEKLGFELLVEPGRAIVGNAGVLVTRVLFEKRSPKKRFVVVDAAMTELVRPALYQAYHAIEPILDPNGAESPADVVGPVCETGDFLARDRAMPELARGDLLAIRSAGAYAASMASTYNARPRVPEVLVDGDTVRVIRERERVEDLWSLERP
jgi:diaminopimelate decarboxylase